MGCKLQWIAFDYLGLVIGCGESFLAGNLDWKSIEEKEQYVRYIGGYPKGTTHLLITSQGQQKLISGDMEVSTRPLDKAQYERKIENVEKYLEERCRELGIDRTIKPRNQ
jgi:hypothetical protein